MARKNDNGIEEIEEVVAAPIVKPSETAQEEVAVIEPVNLPEGEKMVKIAPNFTGTLHVGGINWRLSKDVPINVPISVKEILRKQNGLAPI